MFITFVYIFLVVDLVPAVMLEFKFLYFTKKSINFGLNFLSYYYICNIPYLLS